MIRKLLFTNVMTAQIDVNNKMLPNISKIETKKENWVMIIQLLVNIFFFLMQSFTQREECC